MRQNQSFRRSRLVAFVFTMMAAAAALGRADEVTVKGTVLRGTVVDLSPAGVTLRTEYGTGDVLIPWADVAAMTTGKELYILYGDHGATEGRILSYENGFLLVGEDAGAVTRIDPATIVDVDTPEDYRRITGSG